MKNAASEKYFCFVELAKKAEEVTDLSPLLADEEKIVNEQIECEEYINNYF